MAHADQPLRSVLYMPGSNGRALDKARSLPADALILDLEDSVAPEAKEEARAGVAEALRAGGYGRRLVAVRINALDGPWGEADLDALAGSAAHAVLVPKVRGPDDVFEVGRRLSRRGAREGLAVWAMMETAESVLNAREIAAAREDNAGRRLSAMVLGTNDLARETGAALVPGRGPMLAWLSACVIAARAHGLAVLDGPYGALSDAEGFAAECAQARQYGFDGKSLIHPSQIEAANRAFAPSAQEVEDARRVAAAFDAPENRGRGVVALDGRMVERLHADMARRILALAEAIAARAE